MASELAAVGRKARARVRGAAPAEVGAPLVPGERRPRLVEPVLDAERIGVDRPMAELDLRRVDAALSLDGELDPRARAAGTVTAEAGR
jgi:hypothetical protein